MTDRSEDNVNRSLHAGEELDVVVLQPRHVVSRKNVLKGTENGREKEGEEKEEPRREKDKRQETRQIYTDPILGRADRTSISLSACQ
jgi:hypothetical protein